MESKKGRTAVAATLVLLVAGLMLTGFATLARAANTPHIDRITPADVVPGQQVTILGTDFGSSLDQARGACVSINGTALEGVDSWLEYIDRDEIKITIPWHLDAGHIEHLSPGTTVTVTSLAGVSNAAGIDVTYPRPTVKALSTSSGVVDDLIVVAGDNFGDNSVPGLGQCDNYYVEFNGMRATDYTAWGNVGYPGLCPPYEGIVVTVPKGATSGPITVHTDGGMSEGIDFEVTGDPPGSGLNYFAEGSTDYGFQTTFSILNPQSWEQVVYIQYITNDGRFIEDCVTVPALSQAVLDPAEKVGATDFATVMACYRALVVERTMTWTSNGHQETHSSVGLNEYSKTWYLPEGSSGWGFETYLCVGNIAYAGPPANLKITYMIEGEDPVTVQHTVAPRSRATYNMADDIGVGKDASIKVESDVPVVAERAMYRNSRGEGHGSVGSSSTSRDWLLAEGCTGFGFTTYILIQNPNPEAAEVTLTWMTPDGDFEQPTFTMPPLSRRTVRVNDTLPGKDVSTRVHASSPVVVERAMYWQSALGEACHASIGAAAGHQYWYIPEGECSGGTETFTTVMNPDGEEVEIELTYLTSSGTEVATVREKVPAKSRRTFAMSDAGVTGRSGVVVRSLTEGRKILAEGSSYRNGRCAGSNSIGGYGD
jgi:hypothetical protein